MSVLSPEYVRAYLQDAAANNYLLEGVQFEDSQIFEAQNLAIDFFNVTTPISNYDQTNFPNKSLLLFGTLWHLYVGAAARAARNTMSYSDAGLQIPIEERYEMYTNMANEYRSVFLQSSKDFKVQMNVESGWGWIPSDYARMPGW